MGLLERILPDHRYTATCFVTGSVAGWHGDVITLSLWWIAALYFEDRARHALALSKGSDT